MVDVADHERLEEAKIELDVRQLYKKEKDKSLFLAIPGFELNFLPPPLPPCQALLTDETIFTVPVLILGNKIDRPEAISEDALRGMFGLHGHTTGKVLAWICLQTRRNHYYYCLVVYQRL